MDQGIQEEQPEPPEVGSMVRDVGRGRIGRVMACDGGRVWLRPPAGGREWTALPDDVRPVSLSESLSPLVAEVNRRSSGTR
ncbi:hypothetical protein [Streptomyces hainanensis]|uniref:Uncharacterized protein n=1 Tax=Streptomyces hainanensis TaxID=402648 RepID=A0A4R4TDX3_9ACTN|nr:hypothetical protein [Streptomyces hainanensis]TDC73073.1 hypothetical protein E1283_20070 [Streptomyces hainanensis]